MAATIQEIAQALNLSHTTVSRVLNARRDDLISAATRERVWEAARQMDFRPHQAARALATGRTFQIALWMRHLYTPFHAQVVHLIEQQIRGSRYQLMIASLDAVGEGVTSLSQWQVDGYLVFDAASRGLSLVQSGSAFVSMGGFDYEAGSVDCVGLDLPAGTREALEHLMRMGCRRIAYVGEDRADPRRSCFNEVVGAAGYPAEHIVTASQRRADARTGVREYVREHGCPDGFLCFNDEVAIGANRGLRDLGLRVPEDAALIGCDGIEDIEYQDPPLSTIALPLPEMCRLGWEFLQRRIEQPALPRQAALLRPTLILRESTRQMEVLK